MHAEIANDFAVADEAPTLSTEDAVAMHKMQLNEAQWARVLSETHELVTVRSDVGLHHRRGTETSLKVEQQGPVQQVAYLLLLEGDEPNEKWKWWETALDAAVQSAQPAPAMTHTEILLPPENATDEMHFALYLGKQAHFGSTFGGGLKFYLDPQGNAKSWRAVPIVGQDAVRRLRAECAKHVGTSYGSVYRLFNYPFSVPPGRSMAWMLDDTVGSPAHCASLTARCLRRALPELGIPKPSAWYGPSTLYLELTRSSRMVSYKQYLADAKTVQATVETERASTSAEMLLRGSDDSVMKLSQEDCQSGIDLLTVKVVEAAVDGDATIERVQQKNLARAMLRWSQVNRGGSAGLVGGGSLAPEPVESPAGMFR